MTQNETLDQSNNEFLNRTDAKVFSPSLNYGVIVALVMIVFMTVAHLMGWEMDSLIYRLLNWVVYIGSVIMFIRHFRDKRNGGYLRIGQGTGLSALTGLWAGILSGIYFFIFVKFIAPEFLEKIQEKAISDMMDRGMSDEQISQAMQYASFFMSPVFMAIMAVIGSVVIFTLIGLIVSAILKKTA